MDSCGSSPIRGNGSGPPHGFCWDELPGGRIGLANAALFPAVIEPDTECNGASLPVPPLGLHTICATFQQIGVSSFYCAPAIGVDHDAGSVAWKAMQLGVPFQTAYVPLRQVLSGLSERHGRHNFLTYHTDTATIPDAAVPEEYFKENLRVAFSNDFVLETSDVDGIFWGQQFTYPIEIKEKTAARDNRLGDYFGLDVGPFVKLAFYAARRGNLHSLFVVREIADTVSRSLRNWWFVKFETLATYASWTPIPGGTNMRGGGSSVVKIPKHEFTEMTAESLRML